MRRARGQHEQPRDAGLAGPLLDALQQPLAIALALHRRVDGQTGHLGHPLLGKRVHRRTAEDHLVVLDHREVADLGLDQCPVALDQRAVGLQRLDQRQNAAHVVDGGFAQRFQCFLHHHRAHAVVQEELQQH